MRGRGKLLAMAAGGGTAITLTLSAPAVWSIVQEHRLIADLRAADAEKREAAAKRLVTLRSTRAVPALVEVLAGQAQLDQGYQVGLLEALLVIDTSAVATLLDRLPNPAWDRLAPACCAVEEAAFPRVLDLLRSPNPKARLLGLRALQIKQNSITDENLPFFARALEDEDLPVRVTAACILSQGMPHLRSIRSCLREGLRRGGVDLRLEVLEALTYTGPAAAYATPLLIEALDDVEPGLRGQAAEAVASIGPHAVVALPTLIARLGDPDWRALHKVQGAVATLAEGALDTAPDWQPVVHQLVANLRRSESLVRVSAASALQSLGPRAAAAVPALIAALDDSDWFAAVSAASALGHLGPLARAAVPALTAKVSDADFNMRRAAAGALERIGAAEPAVVEALAGRLKDTDAASEVASALGSFGAAAGAAVPRLLELVEDREALLGSRSHAIQALVTIAPGDGGVQRALLDAARGLLDDKWSIQVYAVAALDGIARHSDAAVTLLSEALADEDFYVQRFAAEALARLGPFAARAVPALERTLSSADAFVRVRAARAHWRVTGDLESALSTLRAVLVSEERDAVLGGAAEAADVVAEMGPAAASARSDLWLAFGAKRMRSAVALARIREEPAVLVPRLLRCFESDRGAAVEQGRINDAREACSVLRSAAVPHLAAALSSRDDGVRFRVLGILGDMGAEAKLAVPQLRPLLEDPDADVRYLADWALQRIDTP